MMDLALLILRVWLGFTFFLHGGQKLFGWFGGGGIAGTARYFEGVGIRPGRFWAVLAGFGEFGGGVLVGLGFLTPLGALAIVITMVVAISAVAGRHGFWVQDGGYEYNLLIIAVALMLILAGPGAYAIDHRLGVVGSRS
jgi:putative oxidoreductase